MSHTEDEILKNERLKRIRTTRVIRAYT